ncbi:MAG: SHOCT domain-containing protein [Gordonia sp. (in: high G+C Gram-positive bacteria)]
MSAPLTPEAEQSVGEIAQRYGLSVDAVIAMLYAVNSGGGTMAQFSIPELGGSGQWMRGGMTMVGNMFDNALKARVDSLCNELSGLLATIVVFPPAPAAAGGFTINNWWPADLGVPSSTGSQNGTRYAVFPATRRLAVEYNGVTRVFDTGDHQIGGVQQQQGGMAGTLSFTSQFGTFDTTSLFELTGGQVAATPAAAPAPEPYAEPVFTPEPAPVVDTPPTPYPASGGGDDIFAAIESLAGLHQRGILTDEEFATKKAELLGRL